MADEIADAIESNAAGPAEANADGVRVRQHSPRDQIEADKYLLAKTALADSTKRSLGVRLVKLIPPGAV